MAAAGSIAPGGASRSGSRNSTPIESDLLHARRTHRAVITPLGLDICNSNSSGRQNSSSPLSLAPVDEMLRTNTERSE